MEGLIKLSSAIPQTNTNDDDFFDRLSHRYTKTLMVIFSIVLTTNQFVGSRINCWVPAHFSGSWTSYANSYCWVKNTYWLPFHEYIPKEGEDKNVIPYYQWVPIILLIMGLFFTLPSLLWQSMNAHAGIDIKNIISASEGFQASNSHDKKQQTLTYITRQMDRYLMSYVSYHPGCTLSVKSMFARICCVCCGRRHGNYLTTLYLFIKVLYLLNCIILLSLLNMFMGRDFWSYGFEAMTALATGQEYIVSPRFPRVTMCDFKVRFIGNVQRYTVQCALPINLFNEKVFLFVWAWILLLLMVSAAGFVVWVMRAIWPNDRLGYIINHLRLEGDMDRDANVNQAFKFTHGYLKQDGVFILRLISHNTNNITATDITQALYKRYRARSVIELNDISPDEKKRAMETISK